MPKRVCGGWSLHVRLPADLAARVAAKAAADRRSLAQTNALLVEQGLRSLGETGDDGRSGGAPTSRPPAHSSGAEAAPSVSPSVRDTALAEREGGELNQGSALTTAVPLGAAPRSASAGKEARTAAARRSEPCPHRIRAGAYCKRCEKVV